MDNFEKALNELYETVDSLKKNKTEIWEKSQYYLSEWTKTIKQATRAVKVTTHQKCPRTVCSEMLEEQKIVCDLIDKFFERHRRIVSLENDHREKTTQLNKKITELENQYREQTTHFNQLFTDKLAPDSAVSDELGSYELEKDFYPLCENLKKNLQNRFPRADSSQKEIDDFKEYLKLAFLRRTDEKTNELKNALNERYGRVIEEYDKFIDALYDPKRGGRLFGEYGLYLLDLDLNEEARQKLFNRDGAYLNSIKIGGRSVKYYNDKRIFVECKGETNYRHTDELEVLFPGFCARCKNSDDILLFIPPYLYRCPAEPSEEPFEQDDILSVKGEKEIPGAEASEEVAADDDLSQGDSSEERNEGTARLSNLSEDKSAQDDALSVEREREGVGDESPEESVVSNNSSNGDSLEERSGVEEPVNDTSEDKSAQEEQAGDNTGSDDPFHIVAGINN